MLMATVLFLEAGLMSLVDKARTLIERRPRRG
jgi:hypothetical protein